MEGETMTSKEYLEKALNP